MAVLLDGRSDARQPQAPTGLRRNGSNPDWKQPRRTDRERHGSAAFVALVTPGDRHLAGRGLDPTLCGTLPGLPRTGGL